MSVPSDLSIAQAARLEPIETIAAKLALGAGDLDRYGDFMAKIRLEALPRLQAERPLGRYILVTAITPTPLGEGKTTTTVGLSLIHI